MKHRITPLLAALATCMPLVATAFVSTASAKDQPPPGTRFMTTEELWRIFHNRSWIWSDGAGYFPNSKRRFFAYAKAGRKAAYAQGSWFVTWQGKACFRAGWVGVDYDKQELTCFAHRTDGRAIYQKRLPAGDWYVFRSDPPLSGDEVTKLLLGDYVRSGLTRNRHVIDRLRNK